MLYVIQGAAMRRSNGEAPGVRRAVRRRPHSAGCASQARDGVRSDPSSLVPAHGVTRARCAVLR